MGEDIRKNEMRDLLSRTISDLLEAGLTPEELSLYVGMRAADMDAAVAQGDLPSLTADAAIRLGRISYLLDDLRRTCTDVNRVELILRAEVVESTIERFLLQSGRQAN